MKTNEALIILAESARSDLVGSGCGSSHQVPEREKREQIVEAIKFVEKRTGQNFNMWNVD